MGFVIVFGLLGFASMICFLTLAPKFLGKMSKKMIEVEKDVITDKEEDLKYDIKGIWWFVGLNEQIIKEKKLGFYRKELYRLLCEKDLLKKELNKFMIQGNK